MTTTIKISRAHHTRQAIVIMETPERYSAIHGDQKHTTADIIRDHLDREVAKLERTLRRVNFLRQALKQEERSDAITEYYADGRRGDRRYGYARIAWELERTALGDGYYGNALRVAKDLPEVTASDRSLLDRYATGRQGGTDHVALQDLALKIDRAAREKEEATP